MKRTIVAITTTFNGNKRFVTSTFPKFGGQIAVEVSDKQEDAKDFLSTNEAQSLLGKIFNPFERVYQVEHLNVVQPAKIYSPKRYHDAF